MKHWIHGATHLAPVLYVGNWDELVHAPYCQRLKNVLVWKWENRQKLLHLFTSSLQALLRHKQIVIDPIHYKRA